MSINSDGKKVKFKIDCYILRKFLLLIILLLIIMQNVVQNKETLMH